MGDMRLRIGFGTYKITEADGGALPVFEAVRTGYRLIDTAAMYGNEHLVGNALRDAISAGLAKREELVVTTKLANSDRGFDATLRAFDASEKALDLGRIDLYLVHWPASEGTDPDWRHTNAETWRAMERLLDEGRVGAIGVSNFLTTHLEALQQTARVMPMVNQIEFHPGWMQPETLRWCQEKGIIVEGWSPLGRTRLFGNPLLLSLAKKYGKSVSQICLRWAVQHGVVPIPKSLRVERMRENLDIFDFEISPEDMALIDAMPATGESGLSPDTITF